MAPFISIIIPTYNSSATIGACLESIVIQEYKNYEVLLIDGKSNDTTIDIIKSFAEGIKNLSIVSEPDKGIYDAMNKGIAMSKGSWLYFLGSDDELYDAAALTTVYEYIQKYPDGKLMYGNVLTSLNQVVGYDGYTYEKLLQFNICHQTIFYNRSLFEKLRYDLKFKICADWDLNLKVFASSNPIHINKTIAKYNLNGTSSDWESHAEFLHYFFDKGAVMLRYRGPFIFFKYKIMQLLRRIENKLKRLFASVY